MYFATVGNDKTKPQTGCANWYQDFPHPANFMFLVDGATNQPTNNQNRSRVDDPGSTRRSPSSSRRPT